MRKLMHGDDSNERKSEINDENEKENDVDLKILKHLSQIYQKEIIESDGETDLN